MLNVKQLRELMPLSDVCELLPTSRYVVRIPANTPAIHAEIIFKQLENAHVNCLVVVGDDLKFYEIGEVPGEPQVQTPKE